MNFRISESDICAPELLKNSPIYMLYVRKIKYASFVTQRVKD